MAQNLLGSIGALMNVWPLDRRLNWVNTVCDGSWTRVLGSRSGPCFEMGFFLYVDKSQFPVDSLSGFLCGGPFRYGQIRFGFSSVSVLYMFRSDL